MARGRKPKYIEEVHPKQVLKYSLVGLIDTQMADLLEIDVATFYRWQKRYPKFCEAIKEGKTKADANVASSLYKKALGHIQKRKVAFKCKTYDDKDRLIDKVEVVEVEDYHQPSELAMIFWLKNRQPELWRDKKDVEIEDKRTLNWDKVSDAALEELEGALIIHE